MLLALDDVGPGPAVVLIHGFPLDRTMWEAQTAEVGSTYRIIAPDLRGAGESAVPGGVYTIDLLADDVIDTLDALELTEPVVVGGLSMGGYVALSLAIRYPGRFRALMLMNTRASGDSPGAAAGREDLARRVLESNSSAPVVEAMLPKLFAQSSLAKHADVIDRLKRRIERASPEGLASTLRGLAVRPDRTGELAGIGMPTLVIAGVEDQIIPRDEAEGLASGIPGTRLVVVPEAGHMSPVENKAAVNAAILEFLRILD